MDNEAIASDFGDLKGMPTSFLYSPPGDLVGYHDGSLTAKEIEQSITRKPVSSELFSR